MKSVKWFTLCAAIGLLASIGRAGPTTLSVDVKSKTTDREWKARSTLLLSGLTDFKPPAAPIALDRFGGRADRTIGPASGYFRVAKEGGRWYFVDPDGHPFYSVGMNAVDVLGSPTARAEMNQKHGGTEGWAVATADQLRGYGFNTLGCWSKHAAFDGPAKMPYLVQLDFATKYAGKKGVASQGTGHTAFVNNCIPIFDPEFAPFCQELAKQIAGPLKDDPFLLGYFTDNELPWRAEAIDLYLTLPEGDAGRKTAEKWVADHGGKKEPERFLAFCAETYFSTVAAALRAADPNHLVVGSRIHGRSLKFQDVFRAAGRHLDVVSVNYYDAWTPDAQRMTDWATWAGKPFMITEWYAKGEDSGMANTSGAGWLVKTQADRGRFYQNFTLGLAADPDCVGWHWFKYMDNDPANTKSDPSNRDSNKGILTSKLRPYEPLVDQMKALNDSVYPLLDYFDAIPKH